MWDQIMKALVAVQDAAVQMIETSVVRVHRHGARIADNNPPRYGSLTRGLTSKIHAVSGPHLYRARNLVERFFNKIKQCRRVATRYDKLAANYLAFVKLVSIPIWLGANKFTP